MTQSIDKKSLRAQYLATREDIRPDEAKAAGLEVARHLVSIISPSASVVAGYRSVRGELDVFEAMAQLSERGHELCLPVVVKRHAPLIFRRWRIGHKLVMGHYSIEVPPESEPELIPEAVLVPLVAFDAAGHRLGYGAGFYDATIGTLRGLQKPVQMIGIAFSVQQADVIPVEPHDARLDMVVTERAIVRFFD